MNQAMVKILRYSIILWGFLFTFSGSLYADISFEAAVDKNIISIDGRMQLNLTFYGTQDSYPPDLPDIDGFESRYIGPSSTMSIVNGRVSSSITHKYVLIPTKAGAFTIGPFTVLFRRREYTTRPINVEVVKGRVAERREETVVTAEDMDLLDRIFVTMEAPKNKVYINEMIPLIVKLYVSRVGLRDIQFPKIAHEGFSAGGFGQPRQYRTRAANGVIYDVIEFKTSLFGTRPGQSMLGPAEIRANRVIRRGTSRRRPSGFDDFFDEEMFNDFFDRYETYPLTLKSSQIAMTVLSLPKEGRPDGFSGAIGNFTFDLDCAPKDVKAGDPITLTMTVRGVGNFDTAKAPALESKEGFKVYKPKVIKQEDGLKVFEQILMPKSEAVRAIPPISFTYFNPGINIYRTIHKKKTPIRVSKLEREEELRIVESPETGPKLFRKETFGRDIIYIKDSPGRLNRRGGYLYGNGGFIFLNLLPLLALIAIFAIYKRNERLKTDLRYARRLRAPKKARAGLNEARGFLSQNKAHEFYDSVFKTLQEYLGNRYHIAAGGITVNIVDEVLRPKGLDNEMLNNLKDIFMQCDMARYAPSEFNEEKMQESLANLKKIIDYMERKKI